MSMPDFHALVSGHRDYFRSGVTRAAEWRAGQLSALKAMMKERAEDFYAALWTDLRRNRIDADLTDVQYIAGEVDYALAHLLQWMKPASVSTPLMLTPSHAQVRFEPLGVGLIIGTWNYPLMLTLSPLIAAISGGNTAVIKPSEMAAATADVLARRVPEYLDRGAFSVVLGAAPETTSLLEQQTILAKQQREATTNAINTDILRQATMAGNLTQVTGTLTNSLQNFRMP